MAKIGERIKQYRRLLGMTQAELAKNARVSQPTIAALEGGEQETSKKLPAIAKALGVAISQLDPEHGAVYPAVAGAGFRTAKVVGNVQAGVWTEFADFEDAAEDGVEVPSTGGKWAHLKQVAYKVRGNSMDKAGIRDGSFVVAVPYFDARPEIQVGDLAIVERVRRGAIERTVKELDISGNAVILSPRSSDARFKPIKVVYSGNMVEPDGTEIRVTGLVIGCWTDF